MLDDRLKSEGCDMADGFAYMWEFLVKPDSVGRFTKLYGPDGEWVRLFMKAEGYIRTELHRDVHQPLRFVTVDYWRSRGHCERFRADFAPELAAIDRTGEALTEVERLIGEFSFRSRIES